MNLWKHELIKRGFEVIQAIEACGASPAITEACTKASALTEAIEKLIDAQGIGNEYIDPSELMVIYRRYAPPTKDDPLGATELENVAAPLRRFNCRDADQLQPSRQSMQVMTYAELQFKYPRMPVIRPDGHSTPMKHIRVDVSALSDHASAVLYPAIKRAMDDLDLDPLSCSVNVNRAYNDLFDAFWSETPAPASEVAKRRHVVRPRT
ncbi:hypothetical protein C8C93_2063 [Acidovorax sp. 93]|uniref:hypothetical protein n=1 Tax=Acidovorax sp. 93 TaxID=2135632 RepID=UPI000EB5F9EE|nr:hypothetical protein [Acidovorax sp. 93]RKR26814.1 hypothetical protein C8C93_2063 [Acidovorax sp. 93]